MWVIIVAVIIALAMGGYWYFKMRQPVYAPTSAPAAGGSPAAGAQAGAGADLGTSIYQKSSNPVQGKLPDTVAPVGSPLQGTYKNPFQ